MPRLPALDSRPCSVSAPPSARDSPWAVAWAGTKPVASLLDCWLGSQVGLSWAGLALIGPALCIAVAELAMPTRGRRWFKFKARAYAFSKI